MTVAGDLAHKGRKAEFLDRPDEAHAQAMFNRVRGESAQRIRRLFADEANRVEGWLRRDAGKVSDFKPFLDNPLNVCLAYGEGGAFFIWHGPGIYEVHVAFEQRGKEVIDLSHKMLAWMRENMGATIFWARVPIENRHAIMFARLMGWKHRGVCDVPPMGRCELFWGE